MAPNQEPTRGLPLMLIQPTTTRGVDIDRHTQIEEERQLAFPDPKEVRQFRDYARGRQRNTLTRQQNRWLKGQRLVTTENVLRRVLTVLTDRIVATGYQVADTAVDGYLTELWVKNWLGATFAQVVYSTWRDGNAGVSLAFPNARQRVVIKREPWWDGLSGIFFAYDDAGEQTYAVKEWPTPEGKRRTVWYPDRFYRYLQGVNGWEHVRDGSDDQAPQKRPDGTTRPRGEYAWVDGTGQPLGIPAVHFARLVEPADSALDNVDNERDSNYGVSLFAGGMLGLQDCVNEVLRLVLAAARFTAFQIVTANGLDLGVNKVTGEPVKLQVEPGTALTSPSPDTTFGAIPPGRVDQLLAALEAFIKAIASGTNVPDHAIRGQWPSGEALFRAEMPMIDQARKGALGLGPAFASVAHKAVVLANHYGGQSLNAGALITTLFLPPERYDPMTLTELANARADNVSLEEVWRLYGYDEQKRKQLKAERASEASFRTPPDPAATPDLADDPAQTQQGDQADPNVDAGVATTKALNGAQITAVLDVLAQLKAGTVVDTVAVELLVAVGLERDVAEEMVDDQVVAGLQGDPEAPDEPTTNPLPPGFTPLTFPTADPEGDA